MFLRKSRWKGGRLEGWSVETAAVTSAPDAPRTQQPDGRHEQVAAWGQHVAAGGQRSVTARHYPVMAHQRTEGATWNYNYFTDHRHLNLFWRKDRTSHFVEAMFAGVHSSVGKFAPSLVCQAYTKSYKRNLNLSPLNPNRFVLDYKPSCSASLQAL